MREDYWKHRSSGMRCASCMWFAIKEGGSGDAVVGRCRKRAPTTEGYPVVFPGDWCGDHKLDENSLASPEGNVGVPRAYGVTTPSAVASPSGAANP